MSRVTWCALLGLWCAGAAWGYWKGIDYASTHAELKTPPALWPTGSSISRDANLPTLLVFIHPKCPCTRATLRELDRFLAHHRNDLTVYAVIYRPSTVSENWEQTDLVASARELPGAKIVIDTDEVCHRAFGTTTSGECLLYDINGRLVFQGGITPARGHEGAGPGQTALAAALRNDVPVFQQCPAFGCGLENR